MPYLGNVIGTAQAETVLKGHLVSYNHC